MKYELWKQPKFPSTVGWIKKMVHVFDTIPLSQKNEWNNAIWGDMDTTGGYHTKRGKLKRERKISYDITHMWKLNNGTNEPIYEE